MSYIKIKSCDHKWGNKKKNIYNDRMAKSKIVQGKWEDIKKIYKKLVGKMSHH